MKARIAILLATVSVATAILFYFPAIPQSETYHLFADRRAFLGIPNFLNVVSNLLFLFVGLAGVRSILRGKSGALAHAAERWAYLIFFVTVALTAFGSSWYHLHPDDHTLVWDRLPIAMGFMALLDALVAERLSTKAGLWLLAPLLLFGAGGVIYWAATQSRGHGDLRFYALAQFGGLLALVLLITLFPARYTRAADFAVSLLLYGVAKGFEALDAPAFRVLRVVSGHTLKHLFAALSAYWILRMLRLRQPVASSAVREAV